MSQFFKKILNLFSRNKKTLINSYFLGNNKIGNGSAIINSLIGTFSYCGKNCIFVDVFIGKFTCIGNNVQVIAAQHPINYISIHPFFYSKRYGNVLEDTFKDFKYISLDKYNLIKKEITTKICSNKTIVLNYLNKQTSLRAYIGNDVWIGDNVSIMGGVSIGDGAIIGTGAVITKDIPPYAIAVGIPAKVIKYRFDNETRELLLNSLWWENDLSTLKGKVILAGKPSEFLKSLDIKK